MKGEDEKDEGETELPAEDGNDHDDPSARGAYQARNEESATGDIGDIGSGHMNVHDLAAEQLSSTMAEITGGSGRSLGELQSLIAAVESSARRDSSALSLLQNEMNEGSEGSEGKGSRQAGSFPFDRSKQASLPAHVEALVDVGTPGKKMPWINALGKEAKELKERQARQGK